MMGKVLMQELGNKNVKVGVGVILLKNNKVLLIRASSRQSTLSFLQSIFPVGGIVTGKT